MAGMEHNFDASGLTTEQKIDAFRVAMSTAMAGAAEVNDVSPAGAAALYMTSVVAVRQLFGGEHPDTAMQDELKRWVGSDPSMN